MVMKSVSQNRWGIILGYLAGAMLIFAALGWFIRPLDTSAQFGVLLTEETLVYGRVKGIQDLSAGLLTLLFLSLGFNRAGGYVLLVSLLIPVTDWIFVYQATNTIDLTPLLINLIYAIVIAVAAFLLLRSSEKLNVQAV
jgi:hypothetical protein